jgi:predicted Fe-Mo cluster-binding NifX family protein
MKVAISSKGAGLGAWMEPVLGQCGFLVVVTEDRDFFAIENSNRESADFNELALVKDAVAQGINALIAGSMAELTKTYLQENSIKVYQAQQGSVLELVELLLDGKLPLMQ